MRAKHATRRGLRRGLWEPKAPSPLRFAGVILRLIRGGISPWLPFPFLLLSEIGYSISVNPSIYDFAGVVAAHLKAESNEFRALVPRQGTGLFWTVNPRHLPLRGISLGLYSGSPSGCFPLSLQIPLLIYQFLP